MKLLLVRLQNSAAVSSWCGGAYCGGCCCACERVEFGCCCGYGVTGEVGIELSFGRGAVALPNALLAAPSSARGTGLPGGRTRAALALASGSGAVVDLVASTLADASGFAAESESVADGVVVVVLPVAAGGVVDASPFEASMIVSDGPVDWFAGTVEGTAAAEAAADAGGAAAPEESRRPAS